MFVKLYKKLKSAGHLFEVIFVSSDRSEESFNKYFSTMPWLAVPYKEEQKRKELAHLYGVGGQFLIYILYKNCYFVMLMQFNLLLSNTLIMEIKQNYPYMSLICE